MTSDVGSTRREDAGTAAGRVGGRHRRPGEQDRTDQTPSAGEVDESAIRSVPGPRPPADPRPTADPPRSTRREADPPADGARRTRREASAQSGPSATRREDEPRPGPNTTRREQPSADGGSVLPADLAARFPDAALLPDQGAEADVFHVHFGGASAALKVYRRGAAVPDPEVTDLLTDINHPRIVRTHETGTGVGGERWELMEYLPDGNLRSVMEEPYGPSVHDVVAQIVDGLHQLHERQIVHRDLKPENVLVRSLDPLELVLTDFGLSRRVDKEAVYSSQARSVFYAAPEAFEGKVSESRDWWSLGIMVREFAGNTPLFEGYDERQITRVVLYDPIDTASVTDRRLELLARGLLVKKPDHRWGATEVAAWSRGESPAVVGLGVATATVPPFPFGTADTGEPAAYDDPVDLAEAMADRWAEAARLLYVSVTSTVRDDLFSWGTAQGLDTGTKHAALSAMQHHRPDLNLLLTLRWLHPGLRPIFRGEPMSARGLQALATRAAHGEDSGREARRTLDELAAGGVFDILRTLDGGEASGAVGDRWSASLATWPAAVASVGRHDPRVAPYLHEPETWERVRAGLLQVALSPMSAGAELRRRLKAERAALVAPVGWFDDLLRGARDDAELLAGLEVAWLAQGDAEREVAAHQAALAGARARRKQWARHEWLRRGGRPTAVLMAVLGAVPVALASLLPTLIGVAIARSYTASNPGESAPSPAVMTAAVGFACLAALCHIGGEMVLGHTLGRDYHPAYSALTGIGLRFGSLGRALRDRTVAGRSAFLLCLPIPIVGVSGFAASVPVVFPLAWLVTHGGWLWSRHRRWTRFRVEQQSQTLGWQP